MTRLAMFSYNPITDTGNAKYEGEGVKLKIKQTKNIYPEYDSNGKVIGVTIENFSKLTKTSVFRLLMEEK